MLWWKKQPENEPQPSRVELVPDQLAVNIFPHRLQAKQGELRLWTYVTEGLLKHNQADISITLLRQNAAPPPDLPLQFFKMLWQVAQEGRIVYAGDYTQFGNNRFLGYHLAYFPAQPLHGVVLPDYALSAIGITDGELYALQELGPMRVMALLGFRARFFPYPPWIDPKRPEIDFLRHYRESALMKLPRIRVHQVTVVQLEDRLEMRLPSAKRPHVAEMLGKIPEDMPFVFLTDLDEYADCCLVWEPGQRETSAIGLPGSQTKRRCGCFVGIVPEDASGGKPLEDGFFVVVPPDRWASVRQALSEGENIRIDAEKGYLPLHIEWV